MVEEKGRGKKGGKGKLVATEETSSSMSKSQLIQVNLSQIEDKKYVKLPFQFSLPGGEKLTLSPGSLG